MTTSVGVRTKDCGKVQLALTPNAAGAGFEPMLSTCRLRTSAALTLSGAAIALILNACTPKLAGGNTRLVRSEELQVREGELVIRQYLSGHLRAAEASEIGAPDVGIFPLTIRWLAEDGAVVKEGDQVVEFDNATLVNRLEQLERSALEAEITLQTTGQRVASEVEQARFDLVQKRADLERATIEAIVPEELRSALENARLQLNLEKAQLEHAESERAVASAIKKADTEIEIERVVLAKAVRAIANARAKIDRLTIRAQRSGVVVMQQNFREDRMFQVGDSTFPGSTIALLPDLETLQVQANLFDVDDGSVAPGMPVEVMFDAFPNRSFSGRVRSVEPVARQLSRNSLRRTFGVAIEVDELETAQLLPGMSARISGLTVIKATAAEPRLAVAPRSALHILATSEGRRLAELHLASGDVLGVELGACSSSECIVLGAPPVGTRLIPVTPQPGSSL